MASTGVLGKKELHYANSTTLQMITVRSAERSLRSRGESFLSLSSSFSFFLSILVFFSLRSFYHLLSSKPYDLLRASTTTVLETCNIFIPRS